MFLSFQRNHIFKPRVELFHLLLAKKKNARISWKSNEHGISRISCISYISCITGVQSWGLLIQTWYSLQTRLAIVVCSKIGHGTLWGDREEGSVGVVYKDMQVVTRAQ